LLNKDKTHHIYVYRVKLKDKTKEYIWYGKYELTDKNIKPNIGKDKILRNVIVLSLKRIDKIDPK
jgi:hypothetical protein